MISRDEIHELISCEKSFYKISDVCKIITGKQLNRENMLSNGPVPVINGGIDPSGYVSKGNQPAGRITISQGGNSAGFVNYIDVEFWAGAHCYVVSDVANAVDYRYLYHFLKSKEKYFMGARQGAGIPGLKKSIIQEVLISIPPLNIQKKIANILDSFIVINRLLEQEMSIRQDLYESCCSLLYKDPTIMEE